MVRSRTVEEHYTPAGLAQRLGVSRRTVYRLLTSGDISPVRRVSSTLILIPASSINRWLDRQS